MTHRDQNGNTSGGAQGIWAPLSNVTIAAGVVKRAQERAQNLPGLVVLYGQSGLGKSMAAAHVATRQQGYYVECRSFFTKRLLLAAILKSMGVRAPGQMGEMLDAVSETLMLSGRPLIIDEADHIIDRRAVEIVRDVHEAAPGCTILLIGEEQFPRRLAKYERVHNRVLIWQPAKHCTPEDARRLAQYYAPEIEIADDLLSAILTASRGIVRRACVNIEQARHAAASSGAKRIDLAAWGRREFYTGEAPARAARGHA